MSACTEEDVEALRGVESATLESPGLRRVVFIRPEFDCLETCAHGIETCAPPTGGWHGIAARRITWGVAATGRGGVSFELHTPFYTSAALAHRPRWALEGGWEPLGCVDAHFVSTPLNEIYAHADECLVTGANCWSALLTTLQADVGWECFRAGGTEAVWTWLGEAWLPTVMGAAR